MRFIHECTLRWSDMDAYGHVNNSRFLTLLEEARVALLFRAGGGELGSLVIARHEIDYLRPVDFGTGPDGESRPPVVRIELWIDEVRVSRFAVGYELFDVDVLAVRARSVCVPYDLQARAPRRLTAAHRSFLADWAP